MKTTNLEISKKLAEIGFKAETDKCWAKIKNLHLDEFDLLSLEYQLPRHCNLWYLSYDFETLLDSLKSKGHISLFGQNNNIWFDFNDEDDVVLQDNESLADMAGRLIIKLHEKGLIKFGGENE